MSVQLFDILHVCLRENLEALFLNICRLDGGWIVCFTFGHRVVSSARVCTGRSGHY